MIDRTARGGGLCRASHRPATMEDPQHILEMLARNDEEGLMWSLTCLEQMNERLALSSDAREILHYFPPSAFVPALIGVLTREVHVCPDTAPPPARATAVPPWRVLGRRPSHCERVMGCFLDGFSIRTNPDSLDERPGPVTPLLSDPVNLPRAAEL